jgi:hypothetical protein
MNEMDGELDRDDLKLLNLIAEFIVEIIIKETGKDNHGNNAKLKKVFESR